MSLLFPTCSTTHLGYMYLIHSDSHSLLYVLMHTLVLFFIAPDQTATLHMNAVRASVVFSSVPNTNITSVVLTSSESLELEIYELPTVYDTAEKCGALGSLYVTLSSHCSVSIGSKGPMYARQ